MGVGTYMLYDDEDDDDTTIVSETKSESDNADESVVSFEFWFKICNKYDTRHLYFWIWGWYGYLTIIAKIKIATWLLF